MARTFANAAADLVRLSLGATNFTGPLTAAAILRRTVDSVAHTWYQAGNTAGAQISLWSRASDNLMVYTNGTADRPSATLKILAADGWCLIAVSKASGTTIPKFHKYVFSTNTWTHENASSTIADPSTPINNTWIGRGPGANTWDGDIAMVGVWNVVLTDPQIECLPFAIAPWFQVSPKGLWILDQQSTAQSVVDLSGGGANQASVTGTSVATTSVPVFSYGAPTILNTVDAPVVGGGVDGPRNLLLMGAG